MDRLEKSIKKLTPEEAEKVSEVLELLLAGTVAGLDIKKLKGHADIYRVRTGAVRIIFRKYKTSIELLEIARRNEKTYKKY